MEEAVVELPEGQVGDGQQLLPGASRRSCAEGSPSGRAGIAMKENCVSSLGIRRNRGVVLWFTGLSGAGKSTLSRAVQKELINAGQRAFVLDGDSVRLGLCNDLGYSREHRTENARRVAEVARLFAEAEVIALVALISPAAADRNLARKLIGDADFIEIFCRCPLEVCEARDVKGLYASARVGLLPGFTGISAPYDPPDNPELILDTHEQTVNESVARVLMELRSMGIIDWRASLGNLDSPVNYGVAHPPAASRP